ncbi:MAG: S1C family serine protease [Rhodospirillales bacterium]
MRSPSLFPATRRRHRPTARAAAGRRLARLFLLLPLAALLLLPLPAAAAPETEALSPRLLDAVVKVESKVPPDARSAASLGTSREGNGVVIDNDGLVLTIGYLVMEANEVSVMVRGGRRVPARIVAYDYDTGFGLLRAEAPLGIKPMELGDSRGLSERDPVLVAAHGGTEAAIGALVASRRRFAGYWEYMIEDAIFTAPPHPSFGGAALIDKAGKLVGIGSLIVPDAVEEAQLPGNMFVPIDLLKPIFGDLLASGRSTAPRKPWLGIWSQEALGRVVISRVVEDGPAASAGLAAGDLVLTVGGRPVTGLAELYQRLWEAGAPGAAVRMTVLKGVVPTEITIKSGDRYDWLRLNRTY